MKTMRAIVLAMVVVSCRPKTQTLDPEYCEGGIINGKPQGGECASFKAGNTDGHPKTVGTIMFSKRYTKTYVVRNAGKARYELVLDGVHAGVIEQDGSWIRTKFEDGEEIRGMRSDAPGFLM